MGDSARQGSGETGAPQKGLQAFKAHVLANKVDVALWAIRLLTILFTIGYILPVFNKSIGGGSQGSGSLLERSITPLSLGSMSSLHDVFKVGTEKEQSEDSSCGPSPPPRPPTHSLDT